MPYNKENFRRIAGEFANKRSRAEDDADLRRIDAERVIPELRQIHLRLSESGLEIFESALSGKDPDIALAKIKNENTELRKRKTELLLSHGFPADYTEPKYECSLCHDTGYSDGKMCKCMRKALTLAGIESSGLGGLVQTQKFDTFSLDYYSGSDRESAGRNLGLLKDFAESFSGKADPSWLLMGATGLGKTHLSSSVAMRVIDRGFDVIYVTAGSLFSVFERQRFGDGHAGDGSDDQFYYSDLLIIDDLGTEISNQFTLSCMYNVINSRIISGKSTIINTNLTVDELRARYADRITSRLFGEYRPLLFSGTDIRAQKLRNR